MSSDIVIRAENLGKKYIIGHQSEQERYTALRDVIGRNIRNLARSARDMVHGRQLVVGDEVEEFWALRDVNFEIKRGDVVGIIGRNGAGKSTLLKILSRITEPSAGRVEILGRVASLLEVGTGFHPELTGRENIYLNGAILGMTRTEIKQKFEEIVDFAGVEKFLDTPVKRYSSGMYVRLAFAVAAHLEPEILVVDEVLAVGDAEFQKKCLGKMESVAKGGRTVLFVSHNMNMIRRLCNSGLLLNNGVVEEVSGNVDSLVLRYHGAGVGGEAVWKNDKGDLRCGVELKEISVRDRSGKIIENAISREVPAWVFIDVVIHEYDPSLTLGYAIYSENGDLLYWSYTTDTEEDNWIIKGRGRYKIKGKIPIGFLNEGRYRIEFISSFHFRCWAHPPGKSASIWMEIKSGLSRSPLWQVRRPGLLAPLIRWENECYGENK